MQYTEKWSMCVLWVYVCTWADLSSVMKQVPKDPVLTQLLLLLPVNMLERNWAKWQVVISNLLSFLCFSRNCTFALQFLSDPSLLVLIPVGFFVSDALSGKVLGKFSVLNWNLHHWYSCGSSYGFYIQQLHFNFCVRRSFSIINWKYTFGE